MVGAVTAAILVAGGLVASAGSASAAPAFQLPFPCGQQWRLNTWDSTHAPALDMVREPQSDTEGSPVVAPAAGRVNQSFVHANAGNVIQIDHGGGYFTTYLHLQSRAVSVGTLVVRGQLIGRVGHTGPTSNGVPHLHYEQGFDSNGDGSASWGFEGAERVAAVFNGVTYGPGAGGEWRNVASRNCSGGSDTVAWVTRQGGLQIHASDGPYAGGRLINASPPSDAYLLPGDWDGDGDDTVAWVTRQGGLQIHASDGPYAGGVLIHATPNADEVLVAGDWNGDGTDTVAWVTRVGGLQIHGADGPYAGGRLINANPPSDAYLVPGDWDGV